MALTVTIFEAVWTTTTTPKTVSVTGAVAGDWIAVIAGGDQSSGNGVTAVTSSTTGGSTTAWTELAEDLDSGASVDWYHAAKAQVTADGTVTVQVDRTKTGAAGGEWGFFAVLGHDCAGVNLLGELGTAGATEAINGTVSNNSAIAFAEFDWEPQAAATAWTPAGQTVIEATQFTDATVAAAYWTGQAAGTRNYGTTNSTSATIKAVAVELLETVVSPSVPAQQWPSIADKLVGSWPRPQMGVLGSDTVDSGSYSGGGSLTVTAATVADGRAEGTASLTETATITASGRTEGSSSLTETATITAAGQAQGTASLTETATITTSERGEGTASLTATATISATGGLEGQYSGTASLTETATITADGQAQGSGSLSETAAISSSGRAEGSASLTATATITATGQLQGSSSAALTVTDTITASGETRGTASLTETATITPTGAAQGTATRSTTATITSSGRAEGSASLVESANITAAGNMSAAGQAALVVGVAFFAAGGIPTGATIMSRVSTGSDGLRAGTGRGLSRVSTGSPLSRA